MKDIDKMFLNIPDGKVYNKIINETERELIVHALKSLLETDQ